MSIKYNCYFYETVRGKIDKNEVIKEDLLVNN